MIPTRTPTLIPLCFEGCVWWDAVAGCPADASEVDEGKDVEVVFVVEATPDLRRPECQFRVC